jgi:hypothetical protein
MKASNEFIILRLYSSEQANNIMDCLYDNGYRSRNLEDSDGFHEDIIKIFNKKHIKDAYFIEIDNEIREYSIFHKKLTFLDIRKDKIKKIKDGLSKIK